MKETNLQTFVRYHKTLEPGMNVLVPVIDKVKYVHSLKEITVDIPQQVAVTSGDQYQN